MIVRLFHSGVSNGESPVRYLLGDKDHQGQPRAIKPEVLAGDPQTTIDIINSINRKYKYTSGCLSFRNSEHPTREQMQEVIADFKATFCPGLDGDHFNSLFVLHQDKGNTEIHFVIPAQELRSGRRLNIHPPGQRNLAFFEAYTRVTNHKLGYAQVVVDPLKMAFTDFERKTPFGRKEQSDKRWVHKHLVNAVANGEVQTRDDLCRYLDEELGITITRQGEDYLSVKFPGGNKAKRLRGALYGKDADYRNLLEQSKQAKQPKFLTPQEFETEQARLNQFIQEREQLNVQTYLAPRTLRRLAKPSRPVSTRNPVANTTPTTRSPSMKTTIRLPVIRSMILEALKIAREKIREEHHQQPAHPVQVIQAKDRKKSIQAISQLRDKAFGGVAPEISTGFAELTIAITEVETSLSEAIDQLSHAKPEQAEKLRQRIFQLQQQLVKLKAQKMKLPVQGEEQVAKGIKFKK